MTENSSSKGPEEKDPKAEKPPKIIKLKKLPDGAGRKKPEGPAPEAAPPAPVRDPRAFSRTCAKCGKGLSSDHDEICAECALKAAQERKTTPEPVDPEQQSFLDTMKELLAEVEREQEVEDAKLKEVKEKFHVKDAATANWAAGKIAMWQNEVERRKYQAKVYIQEAERAVKSLSFLFLAQLEAWAKVNIPQDRKHIKLPSATLKFTDTKEKLEIVDEKAVVAWATVHLSDAVEMKPVLTLLKDQWIKDKVVPAGCEVIPAGQNFKVE
jgi:hypothetical protein